MPYVVISSYFPAGSILNTTVGDDRYADEELMKYLGAKKSNLCRSRYVCEDVPLAVLDKLELIGYKVIAMAANKDYCYWTLHKPGQ